jgi:hypothetical protein
MDTTRNSSAIWWWVGGIVAVALIIWAIVANNNNAGIPNTGVDNSASSSDILNNGYTNPAAATSTGNPTMDNAKG